MLPEPADGNVVPLSPGLAPPRRRVPPDVQHTSIYVPKVAYRKIREIALIGDRRPHDVIMQGIDLVLEKHGFPSIAELKSRKA
jgi:hypothetical protein